MRAAYKVLILRVGKHSAFGGVVLTRALEVFETQHYMLERLGGAIVIVYVTIVIALQVREVREYAGRRREESGFHAPEVRHVG